MNWGEFATPIGEQLLTPYPSRLTAHTQAYDEKCILRLRRIPVNQKPDSGRILEG
jgi:hypothetical protein